MGQLPLVLGLDSQASFASYVAGENRLAAEHVEAVATHLRKEFVWLAGESGVGKTHLLAAACRAAQDAGLRPMYLALSPEGDPRQLDGLDRVDVLALDGIDQVAGHDDWESGLFPLIDARMAQGGLIMAARSRPRDCGYRLQDLLSRLASAAVYRLAPLADDDLARVVIRHADQRGLELDESAVSYLLQRVSRNPGELVALLDRVDRFSLAAQRRVTIPLLRQVIELADNEEA